MITAKRLLTLVLLQGCVFHLCLLGTNGQTATAQNKFESEIRKFVEADKLNPPPQNGVLFIGSSSIRLWKNLESTFSAYKAINRGFGGSEIKDATFYANQIIFPYKPRLIVFYAGDNDLASGKTPQQVFDDYKMFVQTVRMKLPKTKIAFISIKPSPSRWHLVDNVKTANKLIKDYSAHNKGLNYIDVFTPMLGADGKPQPDLFIKDNLHMTEKGYVIWKSVIEPYLK